MLMKATGLLIADWLSRQWLDLPGKAATTQMGLGGTCGKCLRG
jgi:hypothetical protein